MSFTLPPLPYAYDALEPFIDASTMEIHHGKHHQAYIDKANAALEGTPWIDQQPNEILAQWDSIPAELQTAVRNQVGGHCNHSFFWKSLAPATGQTPSGELKVVLESTFDSVENFRGKFVAAATGHFGSGWAWLVLNAENKLEIMTTPNQDSPLMSGKRRVLGVDLWEHAYYLNYQNRRPEYLEAWWQVINWDQVGEWFEKGGV